MQRWADSATTRSSWICRLSPARSEWRRDNVGERFNLANMSWGLAFTALGVAFLLEAGDVWHLEDLDVGLIIPLVLLTIGVIVLLGSLGLGRRKT
jgi:hypothetical protein